MEGQKNDSGFEWGSQRLTSSGTVMVFAVPGSRLSLCRSGLQRLQRLQIAKSSLFEQEQAWVLESLGWSGRTLGQLQQHQQSLGENCMVIVAWEHHSSRTCGPCRMKEDDPEESVLALGRQ